MACTLKNLPEMHLCSIFPTYRIILLFESMMKKMISSKKIITKLTAAGLSAALALSSFGMTVMAAGLSNPEMSDKYCEISDYDSSIIANQYYDAIIALRDGLLDHSESINVSSFKIPSTAVSAFYDATLSLCPECPAP